MKGINSRLKFGAYKRFSAWSQAVIDAVKDIPWVDQDEPVQYEKFVLNYVEYGHSRLAQGLAERVSEIRQELSALLQRRSRAQEKMIELSHRLKEALQRNKKAEESLKDLEPVLMQPGYYLAFFIFLVLAEFPLNAFVFSLFGEARFLTYLMAAGVCFAIPWTAHIIGRDVKEQKRLSLKLWLALMSVVSLLSSIAYLRQRMLEGMGLQELIGIQLNPGALIIIFLSVNFAIFAIAFWTSFASHPRDSKKDRNIRVDYKQSLRDLARVNRERELLEMELDRINMRIERAKNKLKGIRNEAKGKIDEYIASGKQLVGTYRRTNIRWRKDKQRDVKSFLRDPAFAIPQSLEAVLDEIEEARAN